MPPPFFVAFLGQPSVKRRHCQAMPHTSRHSTLLYCTLLHFTAASLYPTLPYRYRTALYRT